MFWFLFSLLHSALIKRLCCVCLRKHSNSLVSAYFGMTSLILCKNNIKSSFFRKLSIAFQFPWTIHNLVFQTEQTTLTEICAIHICFQCIVFLVKKTLNNYGWKMNLNEKTFRESHSWKKIKIATRKINGRVSMARKKTIMAKILKRKFILESWRERNNEKVRHFQKKIKNKSEKKWKRENVFFLSFKSISNLSSVEFGRVVVRILKN